MWDVWLKETVKSLAKVKWDQIFSHIRTAWIIYQIVRHALYIYGYNITTVVFEIITYKRYYNRENANAKANDSIKLFSIQMQMSMHYVIVTAIVIMADHDKICHDNDSGDNMHAYLH